MYKGATTGRFHFLKYVCDNLLFTDIFPAQDKKFYAPSNVRSQKETILVLKLK